MTLNLGDIILWLRKFLSKGNYAVLVKSGFTHLQALLFNFFSACTGIIGFYIGSTISTNSELSRWIFTMTAGGYFDKSKKFKFLDNFI